MPVPQCGDDIRGDDTDGAFYRRFVLGRTYSGGNDSCRIMFRQLLICPIQDDLLVSMLFYAGFQVVALNHPGNAAEIIESIDVRSRPGLLVHAQKCFHIAVGTARQRCHKDICGDDLAGLRVHDCCCITSPVHLQDLTGLVIQMHGSVDSVEVITVVLVELSRLVWHGAFCLTLVAVFQPQQR